MITNEQRRCMETTDSLRFAEEQYLASFGWSKLPGGAWSPPTDLRYPRSSYEHQHAVNVQKRRSIAELRNCNRLPQHVTFNECGKMIERKFVGHVDLEDTMTRRSE